MFGISSRSEDFSIIDFDLTRPDCLSNAGSVAFLFLGFLSRHSGVLA